jgi:DNA mismatch repair protein MutL
MRRAGRMGDQETRIFERQAGAPARVFQVHESYLVCETDDGIAIIDQHALHERVQYDRILKRLAEGGVETQRLLVPEEVELAAEDLGVLSEHADLLARCGLAWSPFGDRSIALETLPVVIPRAKAAELVRDILELLRARGSDIDARTLFHDVADTMACKAAVRFGDRLSRDEAAALIEESGALDKAFVCPHGRPTVLRLTLGELEKHFRR